MLKIFAYILLSFTISFASGQVNFELIPIADAIQRAKESNKLIFVEFTAEGCPPCVAMEKAVFENLGFGNLINEKFVAVKSNGISVNSKFEKMRYKITSFPTIVYFNSNGEELFRVVGKKTLEEMTQVTNLILEGNIEKALEVFPLPIEREVIYSKDTLKTPQPIIKND